MSKSVEHARPGTRFQNTYTEKTGYNPLPKLQSGVNARKNNKVKFQGKKACGNKGCENNPLLQTQAYLHVTRHIWLILSWKSEKITHSNHNNIKEILTLETLEPTNIWLYLFCNMASWKRARSLACWELDGIINPFSYLCGKYEVKQRDFLEFCHAILLCRHGDLSSLWGCKATAADQAIALNPP